MMHTNRYIVNPSIVLLSQYIFSAKKSFEYFLRVSNRDVNLYLLYENKDKKIIKNKEILF
jgi:hypothetical protein